MAGGTPERGKHEGVHEEIRFGVEVAAEHRDLVCRTCELPVGVVEDRLEDEQESSSRVVVGCDQHRRTDPGRRGGYDHCRWGNTKGSEQQDEEVCDWPKHELANNLERRALLPRRCKDSLDDGSGHAADARRELP